MKCDEHERLPWLRALMRKPMFGEGVQILLQDLAAFVAQAPDSEIWTARIGRLRYEITLALQGYRDVLKGERQHVADLQAAMNKLNRKDADSEQDSDRESRAEVVEPDTTSTHRPCTRRGTAKYTNE